MRSKLVLVLAGLILACGVSEISLRVLARYNSQVNFLCKAGVGNTLPAVNTLQSFLSFHRMQPFRDWRGYFANSWGMNDTEFGEKVPGTSRIIVLGDSQAYSMVAYPDNFLTRAENELNAACAPRTFEIFNLGIPGAGVWDYKVLSDLAVPVLKPDAVLLNFYMGNDSADTFRGISDIFRHPQKKFSYALAFIKNSFHLLMAHGVDALHSSRPSKKRKIVPGSPSGSPILGTDNDPVLRGPTHGEADWLRITSNELRTLFHPQEEEEKLTRSWKEITDVLDSIRDTAGKAGAPLSIIFFPSEFQVSPAKLAEGLAALNSSQEWSHLDPTRIDPMLPNKQLEQYCAAQNLSCFDLTPALKLEAENSAPLFVEKDSHLNLRGNALAASALAAFLKKKFCP